ncbi:YtpI family protein [Lederbergia sp. NSJ-179]|uniref:YtpI family protein n=1 Tax=Lederbergia sp. NSJ-179 TaxID=2931402 RepID=UPI001FD47F9B|nr:YtpI family protein [Lederbergia sp. NSJ-179]MCJ7839737.1 YtpI family protein [Lederbergia sp. NSJ-179]
MPVLIFFIVFSFSFYVFYKIKYVRSRLPMERKLLNGKSSLALGSFIAFFGINQLFLFQTPLTYVIGTIFIILGIASAWAGFKSYRYHIPYAVREAEEMSKQT